MYYFRLYTERRPVEKKKKAGLNRLYDKLHDFVVTTILLYLKKEPRKVIRVAKSSTLNFHLLLTHPQTNSFFGGTRGSLQHSRSFRQTRARVAAHNLHSQENESKYSGHFRHASLAVLVLPQCVSEPALPVVSGYGTYSSYTHPSLP